MDNLDDILTAPIVTCGCCGDLIPDLPEFNVFHGIEPYPADEGFGLCAPCLELTENLVLKS